MARVEKVLEITEGTNGDGLLQQLRLLKEGGLMTKQVFTEFQRLR